MLRQFLKENFQAKAIKKSAQIRLFAKNKQTFTIQMGFCIDLCVQCDFVMARRYIIRAERWEIDQPISSCVIEQWSIEN